MDLQKYFADLGDALVSGGMSQAQSNAYCKRLSETLGKLDEAAQAEKLAGYGNPQDLAKKVLSIANKQAAGNAPAEPEAPAPAPASNPALEHTINVDPKAGKPRPAPMTKTVPMVIASDEDLPAKKEASDLQATKKTPEPVETNEGDEKPPKKPISKRGMQIFWWSAGLSSPLTLLLAAALAGAFLFAYAALIFAAVALIVAVTLTVVFGILLAIVCMGYGIVKMLPGTDAFFVGLYEFGLGMIVVGGTIIFPILEYHAATKLVPYGIKKLTVFLKFTIRQIKRLIIHLYDLCRDL